MNFSEKTKKIVFSHHPCIDGVASAWTLSKAFPDEEIIHQGLDHNQNNNIYNNGYGSAFFQNNHGKARQNSDEEVIAKIMEDFPAGQEIYFIDYVPNNIDIINSLLRDGHRVTIYDHHQSALKNLEKLAEKWPTSLFNYVFDEHKSGATITWDALHPDKEPPELLKLIEKMDLLTFENNTERLATCYMDGYLQEPDQKQNLYNFDALLDEYNREGIETFAIKGEAEYADWLPWMEKTISTAKRITLAKHEVTVVQSGDIMLPPRGLVHALIDQATQENDSPVLLMVNDTDKNMTVVNVRVRPECSDQTVQIINNIKDLAKDINGGGRGTKGQIGQGVCRMKPETAMNLGLSEVKMAVQRHR